jgi:tetratricopeptide (TPR) repeat protein
MRQPAPNVLWKALQAFETAVEADPEYAPAHAGIAEAMVMLAMHHLMTPRDAYLCARQAAMRALTLDSELAGAMIPLAWVSLMLDYDWRMARNLLQRALAVEPENARAYQVLADVELAAGRFAQARSLLQAALHIDPVAPLPNLMLSLVLQFDHDYEGALRQAEKVLELEPENPLALVMSGRALGEMGRHEEALRNFKRATTLAPDVPGLCALSALGLARAGEVRLAHSLLFQLEATDGDIAPPSYRIGMAFAALGENDRASKWFLRAQQERSPWAMFFAFDPAGEGAPAQPMLANWPELQRASIQQLPPLRPAVSDRVRNLG